MNADRSRIGTRNAPSQRVSRVDRDRDPTGLLAAAQAVEHYEISRYGTLKAWATKLNMAQAVKLLDATLAEEKKTDETLNKIAETAVNYEAAA